MACHRRAIQRTSRCHPNAGKPMCSWCSSEKQRERTSTLIGMGKPTTGSPAATTRACPPSHCTDRLSPSLAPSTLPLTPARLAHNWPEMAVARLSRRGRTCSIRFAPQIPYFVLPRAPPSLLHTSYLPSASSVPSCSVSSLPPLLDTLDRPVRHLVNGSAIFQSTRHSASSSVGVGGAKAANQGAKAQRRQAGQGKVCWNEAWRAGFWILDIGFRETRGDAGARITTNVHYYNKQDWR